MEINLFTTFYIDKNPERQAELDFCLKKNLNAGFTNVVILVESEDVLSYIKENTQYEEFLVIGKHSRPSFNDFLFEMDKPEYSKAVNIISNTDIFFEDLDIYRQVYKDENNARTSLALSRWDYFANGSSVHFDRWDSQDTWVFYGNTKFRTSIDFTMGVAGCDNRFAHEIKQNGYNVINPSKTIKTYHYHETNIRNYLDDSGIPKDRVPEPYLLVIPI
jgi:hypothetical protein